MIFCAYGDKVGIYAKDRPLGGLLLRVAGAGIEPASGGYEPPEVPLLYPAIRSTVRDLNIKASIKSPPAL